MSAQIADILINGSYYMRGLPNHGNSCFMNTALQILINSFFVFNLYFLSLNKNNQENTTTNFYTIYENYYSTPHENQKNYFNGKGFKEDLITIYQKLNLNFGSQDDATAVLGSLADSSFAAEDFFKSLLSVTYSFTENEVTKLKYLYVFNDIFILLFKPDEKGKEGTYKEKLIDLLKGSINHGSYFALQTGRVDVLGGRELEFKNFLANMEFTTRNFMGKAIKVEYELVAIVDSWGHSEDLNVGHFLAYIKKNGNWFKISDSSMEKVEKKSTAEMLASKGIAALLYKLKSIKKIN